jgi:hypothetical protein
VALFAAAGVINTTTEREKMMKILEIGNIKRIFVLEGNVPSQKIFVDN